MSQETPVQTVLACSQCGRALAQSDLVHIAGNWVCADCKPAFLSRVMASGAAGASPRAWRYGGFWIRFGARFIDGLIFTVPILIFAAVFIPNLIRAGRQAGNPASAPNPAFAAFGFITFFLVFFLAGGCYEILMLKYQCNSRKDGLWAKGHPIRRPHFELGGMLWALLHVECCYQRHSLHKHRPHAGQRDHVGGGRREASLA